MSKHKTEVLACLDMLRNPVDTRADAHRISMCIINLYHEIECLCGAQDEIRAEAIKEFAERLRNKFFNYYDGLTENTSKSCHNGDSLMFYEVADMIVDCIDNLVKEMTGGNRDAI